MIKSIKSQKKNDFTTEFKINDRYVTDNKVVANVFSIYFYNIGKEMIQIHHQYFDFKTRY